MSDFILPFEKCDHAQHHRVGGKCASLGAMIQTVAPVPPGFAVTTDAYNMLFHTHELDGLIKAEIATLASSDDPRLPEVSAKIRRLIEETPPLPAIDQAISVAYEALSARCNSTAVPVAVRSSATAEDLPDASFAGQQDTYLWIVGAARVVEHVRKCWSSIYTARAIAYRLDRRFSQTEISMGVAVQKMVNAKAAGVAFTLNPINGDRSKIAIDASWGLGESVVSGEVTPDNFLIDKVILNVVKQTISQKQFEYAVDFEQGCTVKREIDPQRQMEPSVTRAELLAIAGLAKRVEQFYGKPQDIEWAIDADLPTPDNIVILQSRPETVWSRKPKQPTAPSAMTGVTGMAGMVNTLIKGVKIN